MYPDLSYLLHDFIGTARDNAFSIVKTFGLFLMLAILTAAWLLKLELKRRANIGQLTARQVVQRSPYLTPIDYVLNALFGFFIGFKLPHIIDNMEVMKRNPAGTLFSWEGNWPLGLLGAAAFTAYYYWRDRQLRQQALPEPTTIDVYPHDRLANITTIAAISGVVGAKLFAVLEYLPQFFADPLGTLLSGDGLAIYGGLIGGFLGVGWYLRRHGIPLVPIMDAVAPALIIAYGVGRIGCQLAGDGDWGIVAAAQPDWWILPSWTWGFDYPHNVLNEGVPISGCTDYYCARLPELHYPTPLYETTAALLIGGLLWSLRKPLTYIPGLLFCIYLFLNGVERFWIEKIRVNERYEGFLNLTQAEMIATAFMLLGAGIGLYLWLKRPKTLRDT